MNDKDERTKALYALNQAQQALRAGNRASAYRWAAQSARLAPNLEAPWLLLASVSNPRASIHYLKHALELNPSSERARQGMHWAIKRYRAARERKKQEAEGVLGDTARIHISKSPKKSETTKTKRTAPAKTHSRFRLSALLPIIIGMIIICIGTIVVFSSPPDWIVLAQNPSAPRPEGVLIKPTLTPTSTFTPTPTYTFTPTFTPTPTFTSTPTPTSTFTPTPTYTFTPIPTSTPVPVLPTFTPWSGEAQPNPESGDGRWIDINLTTQQLFAYEGDSLLRTFIVSTGTAQYPTVTGQYRVYVKYRYTDMSGPGYYLPDVPYTMYFYRGYGTHGTYWHNNFGTPMSHGCINMITADAGWLFNWASVGTLVNIHY